MSPQLNFRFNKHGEISQPLDPLCSGHRSYKIAVRTAKRRQLKTGIPMAVVVWHNENHVVMPTADARAYDDEELLVEYV